MSDPRGYERWLAHRRRLTEDGDFADRVMARVEEEDALRERAGLLRLIANPYAAAALVLLGFSYGLVRGLAVVALGLGSADAGY